MSKIIRTPTKVSGGITPDEKRRLDEHAALWIKRALRTEPINPERIVPAIEALYAAAGLKKPRVVIAPSPLVMAFAYGAAAEILSADRPRRLHCARTATDDATRGATRAATDAAIRTATDDAIRAATARATFDATDATRGATRDATDAAIRASTTDATHAATSAATDAATDATAHATARATRDATHAAIRAATDAADEAISHMEISGAACACFELAGKGGLHRAAKWWEIYQGGNMWAAYDCYLTAMRDVLGLRLPEYAKYASWEQAAIEGGFRVMHEEFCIVSDFPERICIDELNRPHCPDGPSHRWRDGWSLYHWHGTRVPDAWIADKTNLNAATVLAERNIEVRRAGIEILGWARILRELDATVIDEHPDPEYGTLVEIQLPDLTTRSRFVRARCGTKREFAIGVPNECATVAEAQAWLTGLPASEFEFPSIRT